MKAILFVMLVLCTGCSPAVPDYNPTLFRKHLTKLVSAQRYNAAIQYLESADPAQQSKFDKEGYLAVAEDLIFLPGVEDKVNYEKERDWCFPQTSDVIVHRGWQNAATAFAEKYNLARHAE